MSVAITFDDVSVTDKRKIIVDADIITSSAADAEAARQAAEEAEASAESASGYAESASASAEAAGESAESAAASAEEAEQAVSGLTEDVEELQKQMQAKASVIISTASGSIASFSDGADDMPCKSVVCNVDAVQDLHGQDAPYPAGGRGNYLSLSAFETTSSVKVDAVTNGLKLTTLTDGQYKRVYKFIPFTGHDGSTLYLKSSIVNSGSNDGSISVRFFDDNVEISGSTRLENYATRQSHQVTVPTGTTRLDIVLYVTTTYSGSVNDTTTFTNMMLSLTDIAYKPYSNICPISGWDGVTVVRTGKNLWSLGSSGSVDTPGFLFSKQTLSNFLRPDTYTISFDGTISYAVQLTLRDINDDIVYAKVIRTADVVNGHYSTTFILDRDVCIASIYSNGTSSVNDFMLELGSTESVYEPYQPADSHSLSFPSTVYGGWVDVVKGELHVTHGIVDLGSLNWAMSTGSTQSILRFWSYGVESYTKRPVDNNSKINMICSIYVNDTANNGFNGIKTDVVTVSTAGTLSVYPSNTYTDTAEFKTAMSGVQLVYELATEIVYELDPVTITTLLGNNNIYCNTGDTTAVYPADTKLYIQHLTQPDSDMIADSNIASGKFFMVGNSLYISTSAIAQGETIRVGTNCNQINLAQALNNLAEA